MIFSRIKRCVKFNQIQVSLKEVARPIHEIITQLLLVASAEASPKAIDQTPSNEMTGYVDGNSDFRSLGLGISHQDG